MQDHGDVQQATRRWIGVGRSDAGDAARAGKEAASQAVTGDDTKLLVVFSSIAHSGDDMLRGVRAVAADAALIGCSTAGEIATTGPGSSSVVVAAFGGPGFDVVPAVSRGVSGRLQEAGAEVARAVADLPDAPHRVLLLLTDGLSGNQQDIVRGAYSAVGGTVPLVGGCAGDDLQMRRTYQYFGDEVLSDAIVAVALASDAPLGIGVEHGWQRVGEPMLVTRSADNRLRELDGHPALDVYLDRLAAPDDVRHDAAAFTRFAMTHPLGLANRRGEEVRYISGADFAQRSLLSIAEVPEGGMAWFMTGDEASVMDGTEDALDAALLALDGRAPLGLLAFDCVARHGVLGDAGIVREIDVIGERAGHVPVAGFYTYGEIARVRGSTGLHNQTLVVLALS